MSCNREYLFTCEELFDKIKGLYADTISTAGQLTKIKVDDLEKSYSSSGTPMKQSEKRALLKELTAMYEDMGCGLIDMPQEQVKQFYKGKRSMFNG